MPGERPYSIRRYTDADHNFVIRTWLLSARKEAQYGPRSGAWARSVLCRKAFFRMARPVVESFLAAESVLVACDVAEPDVICAWLCHDGGRVVWAYTLKDMRKMGLQRALRTVAGATPELT